MQHRSETGDAARGAIATVHDRRVQLHAAGGSQDGAATGVEEGVRLESPHHGLHHVDGALASAETAPAFFETRLELLAYRRLARRAAPDVPGSPVKGQGEVPAFGHSGSTRSVRPFSSTMRTWVPAPMALAPATRSACQRSGPTRT